MPFDDEQVILLEAPLDKAAVKQREAYSGGKMLSYMEGHQVIQHANRIFGFDGWSRETVMLEKVHEEVVEKISQSGKPYTNNVVTYIARVRVTVAGVVREGTGFGNGMNRNEWGACHEIAVKEAETDATKRALMTFGNQFGLSLYDKEDQRLVDGQAIADEQAIRELAAKVHGDEADDYIARVLADFETRRTRVPGASTPIRQIADVPAADRRRWISKLTSDLQVKETTQPTNSEETAMFTPGPKVKPSK